MKIKGIKLCKCLECGCLFDEEDAVIEYEYRGECWGQPAYEPMSYSPCCNADYEEYEPDDYTYKCEDCGKIWEYNELDKNLVKGFGTEKEIEICCPECYGEVDLYMDLD